MTGSRVPVERDAAPKAEPIKPDGVWRETQECKPIHAPPCFGCNIIIPHRGEGVKAMTQERERPEGMQTTTWKRLLLAAELVRLPLNNVVQTVGNAPASAGFHAKDGQFKNEAGHWENYCAAFDLSIQHPQHYTGGQLSDFMLSLAHQGMCPYWRHTGSFANNQHLHIVDSACKMKDELQGQVVDFYHGRDGLAGHNPDVFWSAFLHQVAWNAIQRTISGQFLKSNGVTLK